MSTRHRRRRARTLAFTVYSRTWTVGRDTNSTPIGLSRHEQCHDCTAVKCGANSTPAVYTEQRCVRRNRPRRVRAGGRAGGTALTGKRGYCANEEQCMQIAGPCPLLSSQAALSGQSTTRPIHSLIPAKQLLRGERRNPKLDSTTCSDLLTSL